MRYVITLVAVILGTSGADSLGQSDSPDSEPNSGTVPVFYVLAGSFSNSGSADRVALQLRAKDLPAQVHSFSANSRIWYSVRVGPYASGAIAEKALAIVQAQANPQAKIASGSAPADTTLVTTVPPQTYYNLPSEVASAYLIVQKCAPLDAGLGEPGATKACEKRKAAEFEELKKMSTDPSYKTVYWGRCEEHVGAFASTEYGVLSKCLKVARVSCNLDDNAGVYKCYQMIDSGTWLLNRKVR